MPNGFPPAPNTTPPRRRVPARSNRPPRKPMPAPKPLPTPPPAIRPRKRALPTRAAAETRDEAARRRSRAARAIAVEDHPAHADDRRLRPDDALFGSGRQRSEEHTSELQSLMRISYAVFCLKKKK